MPDLYHAWCYYVCSGFFYVFLPTWKCTFSFFIETHVSAFTRCHILILILIHELLALQYTTQSRIALSVAFAVVSLVLPKLPIQCTVRVELYADETIIKDYILLNLQADDSKSFLKQLWFIPCGFSNSYKIAGLLQSSSRDFCFCCVWGCEKDLVKTVN